MSDGYCNTTALKGQRLKRARKGSATQDDIVLGVFVSAPYSWMIAEEVHKAAFTGKTPLTSVRRSLTHLSKLGLIDKSKHALMETSYGAVCHSWRLSEIGRNPNERIIRMRPDYVPPVPTTAAAPEPAANA